VVERRREVNIPLDKIKIGERQRKTYEDIEKLAASITTYGILEPVLVDSDYNLIAGGRRCAAARRAGLTEIPALVKADLTEDQKAEIELEENVQRSDLTWQERTCAIAAIHSRKTHSAALAGEEWGYEQTGELLGKQKSNVYYAVAVAKLLLANDEEIAKCSCFNDAFKLMLARKEEEAQGELQRRVFVDAKVQQLNAKRYDKAGNTYTGLDAIAKAENGCNIYGYDIDGKPIYEPLPGVTQTFNEEVSKINRVSQIVRRCTMDMIAPDCPKVDHIYCDPPYATDMDNIQQEGMGMNIEVTRAEHDVDNNVVMLEQFIHRAWDILPETGFCVLWYDMDQHTYLQELATHAGFRVQRWPLVWVKTHTCQNGAATFNFTKATEVAMVLRKPKAVLARTRPTNYFICGSDKQAEGALHPFWKPLALHKWVLESIALTGQSILDPFAGEGSIPVACLQAGYKPVAYDCNEKLYPLLCNRLLATLK
jgi:DNA modification methylase